VLDRIPGYLPDDADTSHLLEIGGGAGALTDRLLAAITSSADTDTAPAPGHLSVIERDGTFADFLREEFATAIDDGLLDVIEGDALDVDLPDFTACVANLPYGVSSRSPSACSPRKPLVLLMFQAEFAERMVASAGESSTAGSPCPPSTTPPWKSSNAFRRGVRPPARGRERRRPVSPRDPDYEVGDEAFFLRFVKALFTQRRKTVRNAIRNTGHISGLDDRKPSSTPPTRTCSASDRAIWSRRRSRRWPNWPASTGRRRRSDPMTWAEDPVADGGTVIAVVLTQFATALLGPSRSSRRLSLGPLGDIYGVVTGNAQRVAVSALIVAAVLVRLLTTGWLKRRNGELSSVRRLLLSITVAGATAVGALSLLVVWDRSGALLDAYESAAIADQLSNVVLAVVLLASAYAVTDFLGASSADLCREHGAHRSPRRGDPAARPDIGVHLRAFVVVGLFTDNVGGPRRCRVPRDRGRHGGPPDARRDPRRLRVDVLPPVRGGRLESRSATTKGPLRRSRS